MATITKVTVTGQTAWKCSQPMARLGRFRPASLLGSANHHSACTSFFRLPNFQMCSMQCNACMWLDTRCSLGNGAHSLAHGVGVGCHAGVSGTSSACQGARLTTPWSLQNCTWKRMRWVVARGGRETGTVGADMVGLVFF
jgi:hypothetical protein